MHARLLTRTHYQVDEPAYLRTLIRKCTSPIRSCSRDSAAAKLSREFASIVDLNVAAAGYAVDLARATGLIGNNQVWSERGHVLAQIAAGDEARVTFDLSPQETVFFMRTFLETDGAALVYFMSTLATSEILPSGDGDWNALADRLFTWSFRSYAELSTDVAERVRYRQLVQKREQQPFTGRSGDHQCFLHLQTLFRLLLIARETDGVSRRYRSLANINGSASEFFLSRLSDVRSLEDGVKSQVWWEILERVVQDRRTKANETTSHDLEEIKNLVVSCYRRIVSTGVPLCPLRTLFELLQIDEFFRGLRPRDFPAQLEDLKALQRAYPRKVHFHVDRIGRPAFIKLDASLSGETT